MYCIYKFLLCRPNPGFMSQLKLFESMGNIVDSRNDEYKLYRLKSLRLQMQTGYLAMKYFATCNHRSSVFISLIF